MDKTTTPLESFKTASQLLHHAHGQAKVVVLNQSSKYFGYTGKITGAGLEHATVKIINRETDEAIGTEEFELGEICPLERDGKTPMSLEELTY